MDFFESQDRARRSTGRLVVLFTLAVLVLMASAAAVVTAAFAVQGGEFHPLVPAGAAGAMLLIVGLATLYKLAELSAGGHVVAEALGGRLVDPGSTDPTHRRLLNVVEEMAIASGVPVPPVYLLDEPAINAFAAGSAPDAAVIGVTRGCVQLLTRDELQGVIAHEFSHILNGDMRLNLRMIGVLHGILVIGLIGGALLRAAVYTPRTSRRGKDGGGAGVIIGVGVGLAIVGYAGTFFGNLIKASISRQREYLADASAVQFTRNPSGIAGALRKIGGLAAGSRLRTPRAAEASHMYFGQGVKLLGLGMATHPPLEDRIRRIDPSWDGAWPEVTPLPLDGAERRPRVDPGAAIGASALAAAGMPGREARIRAGGGRDAAPPDVQRAIALIGAPQAEHLAWAQLILAEAPAALADAAHTPYEARALVYALLLDADPGIRAMQHRVVDAADDGTAAIVHRLEPIVDATPVEARLPLLELAMPALAQLSPRQRSAFADQSRKLVAADRRVDVFEWLLLKVITHGLDPNPARTRVQYYNVKRLGSECADLLSLLAHAGTGVGGGAEQAFATGAAVLGLAADSLSPAGSDLLGRADKAADTLATLAPKARRQVLLACAATIAADRALTVEEVELFRGIALVLGCPVPPLVAGMPVG